MIHNQYTKSESDYVDLRSLLHNLIEKKWLIILVGIITFGLTMLYALCQPTTYRASVLLKIQNKQHNVLGTITNTNQTTALGNLPEEPVSVQIALIRSEYILRPVIHALGLDVKVSAQRKSLVNTLFKKNQDKIWISKLDTPIKYLNKKLLLILDSKDHYYVQDSHGRKLIQGNVGLPSANNGFTITIDKIKAPIGSKFYVLKYPESSIIAKLRSHLTITDLSSTSENTANKVAILQLSLTGVNSTDIIRTLNEIAITTQKKNIIIKSLEAEKTLEFLDQQLPIIQSSLKKAEEKLNLYRSSSGRINIKLQTEYLLFHISEIDKQLEKIRLEKINMMQQYTSYHPFVIALNQERIELEKQRYELTEQLKKLPASDQEDSNLTRDVTVKNNLYTVLLNQIHQSKVIKAGIVSDIQILSLAAAPDIALPLKLSFIATFSLFTGLVLGCLGVVGWRIFIRRVNDPHWTERTWNIKNLAIIPHSKKQASNIINIKNQHHCLPVLAYHSPNDIAIESLCGLRTFLQLQLANLDNNIISIMGLSKNTGKTFISVNLASLLARMGNKVLLVDGDIRTGHMHHYFSTSNTPGLTDILANQITFDAALIQCRNYENLTFLPRGTNEDRHADLLMNDTFKILLLQISKQYQYVIINTTPNVFTTDNIAIGSCAGTNLLILGSNRHEAAEVDRAINNLHHAGIRLHGCIFNNLKLRKNNLYNVVSLLQNAFRRKNRV